MVKAGGRAESSPHPAARRAPGRLPQRPPAAPSPAAAPVARPRAAAILRGLRAPPPPAHGGRPRPGPVPPPFPPFLRPRPAAVPTWAGGAMGSPAPPPGTGASRTMRGRGGRGAGSASAAVGARPRLLRPQVVGSPREKLRAAELEVLFPKALCSFCAPSPTRSGSTFPLSSSVPSSSHQLKRFFTFVTKQHSSRACGIACPFPALDVTK